MANQIVTLKDNSNNELYPTTLYNAVTDANGVTLPSDFTQMGGGSSLPTTTTAGQVLKSTSTAGTVQWGSLSASDVGALASNTTYVSSVNGSSGAITNIATTSQLPSVATSSVAGLVKPDNSTITVNSSGVITAAVPTFSYNSTTQVLTITT